MLPRDDHAWVGMPPRFSSMPGMIPFWLSPQAVLDWISKLIDLFFHSSIFGHRALVSTPGASDMSSVPLNGYCQESGNCILVKLSRFDFGCYVLRWS